MAENTTATVDKIVANKVSAGKEELLKLDSPAWKNAKEYLIEMAATPLANQPSPYIKATRDEKEIGKIQQVNLKALHNGKEVFFRLRWKSETKNLEIGDLDVFPDAVAVLFPMKDSDTPIKEMGTKDAPTNSWYWRADFKNKPKNQIAKGLSTSLYTDNSSVFANSNWKNGEWVVVMGRAFQAPEEAIKLATGAKKQMGLAAWEGSNGERGGVKAFSKEWRELQLA
jgi:complex iron-sulfur molybdoenzyme family reductase subunit gamma